MNTDKALNDTACYAYITSKGTPFLVDSYIDRYRHFRMIKYKPFDTDIAEIQKKHPNFKPVILDIVPTSYDKENQFVNNEDPLLLRYVKQDLIKDNGTKICKLILDIHGDKEERKVHDLKLSDLRNLVYPFILALERNKDLKLYIENCSCYKAQTATDGVINDPDCNIKNYLSKVFKRYKDRVFYAEIKDENYMHQSVGDVDANGVVHGLKHTMVDEEGKDHGKAFEYFKMSNGGWRKIKMGKERKNMLLWNNAKTRSNSISTRRRNNNSNVMYNYDNSTVKIDHDNRRFFNLKRNNSCDNLR